ncbi:MAG: hypothetical protein ACLTMP_01125 [Eggerthella lenta]
MGVMLNNVTTMASIGRFLKTGMPLVKDASPFQARHRSPLQREHHHRRACAASWNSPG